MNSSNNNNSLHVETITTKELSNNEKKYVGKLLKHINTKSGKQYFFFFFGIRIATISSAGNSYMLYCLNQKRIGEFHFYDQEEFKVYNVLL